MPRLVPWPSFTIAYYPFIKSFHDKLPSTPPPPPPLPPINIVFSLLLSYLFVDMSCLHSSRLCICWFCELRFLILCQQIACPWWIDLQYLVFQPCISTKVQTEIKSTEVCSHLTNRKYRHHVFTPRIKFC